MTNITNSSDLMKEILDVYGIPLEFVMNVSINIPAFGLSVVSIDLVAIKDLEDIEYGDLKAGKVVLNEKTIFSYDVGEDEEE